MGVHLVPAPPEPLLSGAANLAALPAAASNRNVIAKTTDGGVYISDGSAWQQISPPTGTYASPAAVVTPGSASDLASKVASVTSGEIYIPRGTYTVSATLSPNAGVTLRGEGDLTIIKLANAANVNVIEVMVAATDVTIRDLQVDGNRANQSSNSNAVKTNAARTKVINVHAKSANGYNIVAFAGGDDMLVESCYSEDSRDEGIEFQAASRCKAIGNFVDRAGKNGIFIWANTAGGGTAKDCLIADNVVRNAGQVSTAYGIRIEDGASHCTVSGNVVIGGGTTSPGIAIFSSTATHVTNVVVEGNVVDTPTSTGIQIDTADEVTVIGNTVSAPASFGIFVQTATFVTVTGNTVRNAASNEGIRVNSTASNVVVASNVVTGTVASYGIRIQGATKVAVNGNTVAGSALGGILLSSVTQFECNNNNLNGNTQRGLEVVSSTGGSITGNSVSSNGTSFDGITVYSASAGITVAANNCSTNGRCGIRVEDASNIVVTGNVCRNNGQGGNVANANGIYVDVSSGTVANVIVTGNRCYDDQGTKTQNAGIRTVGAVSNVVIAHNLIEGNGTSGYITDGAGSNVNFTAYRLLAGQTVGTTQTTIAHGLPYTPTAIQVLMTSAGTMWRSAASDATNIYLTADAAGRTADIRVG